MHHAIQVPLRIDLGAASVVQAGQTLVVPDVAKHRLQVRDKLGDVRMAGLAVAADSDELDIALAGLFDNAAGDQALAHASLFRKVKKSPYAV